MTASDSKPYFSKVILLMILSVAFFIVMKALLPEQLFPKQEVTANNNIILDDMMREAIEEDKASINATDIEISITDTITITTKTDTNTGITDTPEEKEALETIDPTISVTGYNNLSRFYSKLHKLENTQKGKVRIAYFGDSMTDGDLIVQDIRQDMQNTFGGQGVGFVAITSLSAGGRYSVAHQFSKNWKTQSFINVKKPLAPFGISGQIFMGNDTTQTYWVKYKAQGIKNCTQLNHPILLFGKSKNEKGYISIKADDSEEVTKQLSPTRLLNTIPLTDNNPKSLKIDFHHIDSIPFYGVNFDDGKGIHIDNYSLRGNSGLPLSVFNTSLMNAFDKVLGYDLIILQYGANVLSKDVESYGWYERKMQAVVNNLRNCFPNADILIISTADKATKVDDVMQTIPSLNSLLQAQKNYARKTDSGFINLYSLMGGKGSMITWVDGNLAGKDYTHFTVQGAKKVAKLIHKEIIKGYELYKKNNPVESDTKETVERDSISVNGTYK